MISIKVPARICFFGDHQDYLGLPVIAGSINRYIELTAEPIDQKEFRLHLPDIQSERNIPLDSLEEVNSEDHLRTAMVVLEEKGFAFKKGYAITISGDIPVNAGLSSSSALTVAWIRFLINIQEKKVSVSDEEIGRWAYEAEVEFFDNPGGLMDQYTIAQQGLLYIDTQMGKTRPLLGSLGKLVVAESGISKQTLDVLKNARTYQEAAIANIISKHPSFQIKKSGIGDYELFKPLVAERYHNHWFATIHNFDITQKAKVLLEQIGNQAEALGELMNQHQHILEDKIANTPDKMIAMMNEARKAGALGTKTIGSGGGGCMVAMVTEDTKNSVIEAFLAHGALDAYDVELTYPEQ